MQIVIITLFLFSIATAQDVALTIKAFFFKMTDGQIWYFNHNDSANIEFSMADEDISNEIVFDKIYLNKVDHIVNIYKSF